MDNQLQQINEVLNRQGSWYNIDICLKLPGIMFEYYIIHARTYRYNLTYYLVAHYKIQPAYEDDEISIGDS